MAAGPFKSPPPYLRFSVIAHSERIHTAWDTIVGVVTASLNRYTWLPLDASERAP